MPYKYSSVYSYIYLHYRPHMPLYIHRWLIAATVRSDYAMEWVEAGADGNEAKLKDFWTNSEQAAKPAYPVAIRISFKSDDDPPYTVPLIIYIQE